MVIHSYRFNFSSRGYKSYINCGSCWNHAQLQRPHMGRHHEGNLGRQLEEVRLQQSHQNHKVELVFEEDKGQCHPGRAAVYVLLPLLLFAFSLFGAHVKLRMRADHRVRDLSRNTQHLRASPADILRDGSRVSIRSSKP